MKPYMETECVGDKSIQREINNLIRKNAADWPTKIQDTAYREAVRKKLHQKSDDWCDYKAGTCGCEEVEVS